MRVRFANSYTRFNHHLVVVSREPVRRDTTAMSVEGAVRPVHDLRPADPQLKYSKVHKARLVV